MTEESEFISKIFVCPDGHHIKVEMFSDIPKNVRPIRCATCGAGMIVVVEDSGVPSPSLPACGSD